MSSPIGASSDKITIPSPSVPIPNSTSEQSIPQDSTPLTLAFLILKFPGKTAPILATITLSPNLWLGAPQIICKGVSSPTFTFNSDNLSASGC